MKKKFNFTRKIIVSEGVTFDTLEYVVWEYDRAALKYAASTLISFGVQRGHCEYEIGDPIILTSSCWYSSTV